MPRVSDAKDRLTKATLMLIWSGSYGATSVDDICAKAEVKKGSFYHFFKSKADLEVAALEAYWERTRSWWNENFSASVPPLQRIEGYFDHLLEGQTKLQEEEGAVLGCPLCSVGAEVCTKEPAIREKVDEILGHHAKYLESAIRDAHAEGSIVAPDAVGRAKILLGYVLGSLVQARIANSLAPMRELKASGIALLGLPRTALAA